MYFVIEHCHEKEAWHEYVDIGEAPLTLSSLAQIKPVQQVIMCSLQVQEEMAWQMAEMLVKEVMEATSPEKEQQPEFQQQQHNKVEINHLTRGNWTEKNEKVMATPTTLRTSSVHQDPRYNQIDEKDYLKRLKKQKHLDVIGTTGTKVMSFCGCCEVF